MLFSIDHHWHPIKHPAHILIVATKSKQIILPNLG